jgi:TPR repeat protein
MMLKVRWCFFVLLLAFSAAVVATDEVDRLEARAHELMALDPPDWKGARGYFEEAAALGSLPAASYLGWMHEQGAGVETDHELAVQWYQRVAEGGAPDYAVKLGWMYLGSSRLVPDRARAEHWFGRAIEAGHLPANIALASVLIADAVGGLGIERMDEAREMLETALAGELPLAAFFLARLYVEGIGGHPTDPVLGAQYTRISAEDGQPLMQGWLARMYLEGSGVEEDRSEAAFWAALAASGEDPLGRELHAALTASMSDEERQALMTRTMRWALERR